MLKKALEYNWWKDKKRSEELNNLFLEWLDIISPDEVQIYTEKYEVTRVFTRYNEERAE